MNTGKVKQKEGLPLLHKIPTKKKINIYKTSILRVSESQCDFILTLIYGKTCLTRSVLKTLI